MRLVYLAAMLTALGFAQKPLIEGNPDSVVRVIIYEDLQCPDCADFRKMMDEKILPRYQDKVAFEHRDFPLAKHPWARKAAIAARFFNESDARIALEFRRYALNHIAAITPDTFDSTLSAFAQSHGVDPAKATASLSDPRLMGAVEKDFQGGIARGIAKTPTVLVDGDLSLRRLPSKILRRVWTKLWRRIRND